MAERFRNRREAGQRLAEELLDYSGRDDVVVIGLPRGGIPVAAEVARHLQAPLDIFVVRKLGVPGQEELAFGAIASGGVRFLNEELIRALRLTPTIIQRVTEREHAELKRREDLYRDGRPALDLEGKTVIVADDGLATGATMKAALLAIQTMHPRNVVVAVPVGAIETCAEIDRMAAAVCVCISTPEPFYGVGMWYDDFSQVTDDEVRKAFGAQEKANGQGAA
jgi:predicted phosphoribosyltransferase